MPCCCGIQTSCCPNVVPRTLLCTIEGYGFLYVNFQPLTQTWQGDFLFPYPCNSLMHLTFGCNLFGGCTTTCNCFLLLLQWPGSVGTTTGPSDCVCDPFLIHYINRQTGPDVPPGCPAFVTVTVSLPT